METSPFESSQQALLTGNTFLLLVYGLLMGLVIGFSLGALAQTALLTGIY